ncbi:hypothetical protein AVEN_157140-1 [Araneus ventricosus]|uniref:Uncharacterized protein n=1 Tax=Araneus ventricosus TaxID=182803 RepID=A0A4Y2R468_ARAVE|nr:hypothetical protein AVEN_157140-1 [Araneus ventricosus]
MEENLSENRHAEVKIAHSSEISEECMDLLLPNRHFDSQLKDNPQDCGISVKVSDLQRLQSALPVAEISAYSRLQNKSRALLSRIVYQFYDRMLYMKNAHVEFPNFSCAKVQFYLDIRTDDGFRCEALQME